MFGLNKREGRVFRFSLFAHVFVALSCAAFGFLPSCEEEEKVHVFELASASPFPSDLPTPQVPTPPKVVEPTPMPPKPTPPPKPVVRKPTPPKPKPTPPKVVEPKPTPPPPKPVVRKPTPPKLKPKPVTPQTVSIDQFRKTHQLPKPSPRKPTPPPRKPVPQIDDSKYSLPAPRLGNTPTRSTVSPSVLNAYLSQVQSKMDRIWKRLQASTELGFGGEARLSFRISSNGTIISAKLSKRSGNKALDDLVLRVGRTVGNVGPPPGGKLDSDLEIPFVVN
jgi:TonB family protein